MSKQTNISWTDSTWNLVWGCSKVSPGCHNCYADTLATRYGYDIWGKNKHRRRFGEKHWLEPLRWNAAAEKAQKRHRVFCSSMCDVFEDHPTVEEEREKLWPLIRATPWLDWQLLTKRAERISECLPGDWRSGYKNVWLGVSAENQEWYDKRIEHLVRVPARIRFISAEPLLSSINFGFNGITPKEWGFGFVPIGALIHWVVFGGESGSGHRECKPAWIEYGVKQCVDACVAPFVKQDSGAKPGQQGRLTGAIFNTKQFPA